MFSRRHRPAPGALLSPGSPTRAATCWIPGAAQRPLLLVAALFLGLGICLPTSTAQLLPGDAAPTATVPASRFASWFVSGRPTRDGPVKPADSLHFANPPHDNVPFYEWAEQMFLWLTSPEGKGIVLTSPEFYTVSELVDNQRTLIQNEANMRPELALRAEKPGPHGLPVIVDEAGDLHEVIDSVLSTGEPGVLGNPDSQHKDGRFIPVGSINFEVDPFV